MSHLRAEQGVASLWRWNCAACDERSLRWYLTESDAIQAAREHSYELHVEYHEAPEGSSEPERFRGSRPKSDCLRELPKRSSQHAEPPYDHGGPDSPGRCRDGDSGVGRADLGGDDHDRLNGWLGDDFLDGGDANDRCIGAAGDDSFTACEYRRQD